MINAIKTFIIVSLIVDMFAVAYHCACAPISMSVQAGLGAALLFSLLAAPFLSPARSEVKQFY